MVFFGHNKILKDLMIYQMISKYLTFCSCRLKLGMMIPPFIVNMKIRNFLLSPVVIKALLYG